MTCKKIVFIVCTVISLGLLGNSSFAQSQTFPTGSAIIDMGAATPTIQNSLKPYGLIYALLKYHNVPVNGVINQTKVKDGIDFIYNNKSYKGGTYIISSDFLTSTVSSVLSSWAAQGVLIDYTTSELTVNVTYKLNFAPKWVMDRTNGSIAVNFLNNAGIPSSAFSFKNTTQLGDCDDIFILPHADPSWAVHNNLYFWNKNYRGAIWAGCHAVSILENTTKDTVINGSHTTLRMNFLSTAGLVPFTDHGNGALPYAAFNPADPLGQYIGKTDDAQVAGSETVFLPQIGSAWRAGTKMITSSPVQADIPALSAGPAAVNIYGRGFDGATNGYVCYQSSHNINSGTLADRIAAQRVFFNFSMVALNDKVNSKISASITGVPTLLNANVHSTTLTANVGGDGGPFTYKWTANVAGDFSASTSATTTFKPSSSVTPGTKCIITLVVTDANCSRISFDSKLTTIIAEVPPLASPSAATILKSISPDCTANNTITFNVFDSNVDPNAGPRSMISLTGLVNGTILSTTTGNITYKPNANFLGTEVLTYSISNSSATAQGTISITVGDAALIPVITNDAATVMIDNVVVINVLGNDINKPLAATGDKLYIRDISTKPQKGYAYINTNGTLSYLSTRDQAVIAGGDTFKYLACNDVGYCSIGTVTITMIQDGCSAGQYQLTTTGTTGSAVFTPTADSYIQANLPASIFGAGVTMQVFGFSTSARQALIKFDVSSISTGATVTSAITSLVNTNNFTPTVASNSLPVTVYGALKEWTELGVTFTSASGTISWTGGVAGPASGTDYTNLSPSDPVIAATAVNVMVPLNTVFETSNMKNIVQNWVTTPSSNNGMIMVPNSTGNAAASQVPTFHTNETLTPSRAPKLTINYTSPAACLTIPTTYKPVAYTDTASTRSNTAITINVKANDVNFYGNTNSVTSVTTPAHGTATINGSNHILYTPAGNFVGTDTLTYTITDQSNAQTNTATVRIVVTRVAPVINADLASTNSNTAVTIAVGANDTDPQGALNAPVITVTAKNGTASISNTSIIYTPSNKFTGKDTLIYRRSNVSGDACTAVLSDTAIVYITVNNQAPTAANDSITTFACTPVDINVKANDTDPEGTALTLVLVSNPSNGTATISSGKIRYAPATNYAGTDQFTYRVKDGSPDSLVSNTVTVKVTVSSSPNPNVAPSAFADSDSTLVNQLLNTNVLVNDFDSQNDPISVSITAAGLKAPSNGTIRLLSNKMIRYTPNLNFTGTDTYEYQISDTHPGCSGNNSLTARATVTIRVTALPIIAGGTIWNDVDQSAGDSFSNIKTGTETGTNVNGSIYVYLVDSTSTIIDQTAADNTGVYQLVNVPLNTPKLAMILSTEILSVGASLSTAKLPTGYTNTSPAIRIFSTGTTDIANYDFGVVTSTLSGGSITTTTISFCGTTTPSVISSAIEPSPGTYQWQVSTASESSGFSNIVGANATSYTPPGPITITTYYRRKVSSGGEPPVYSNVIKVAQQTSAAGSITGGDISVCGDINSGTLTLEGHMGSIIKWQSSVNNGALFTDITHTAASLSFANLTTTTQYRAMVQFGTCAAVTSAAVSVTASSGPVIGVISGPCALSKDSSGTFLVTPVANATRYVWALPDGWTGTSATNSIKATAGAAGGVISVTAFIGSCSSTMAGFSVTIIDYARITISGTPTITSGNVTSSIIVKIQLIDINGNNITCSGGTATLCTTSGTFSTVVDHNDGTYTSLLTSSANTAEICGTIGGIPIQKKINLTFTGPQGGIKGNGPILETETPKITFTATAGTGPFTVIYRSAKSTKNDTLQNVTSGTPVGVRLIPSTTLYTLVSVIDVNGERRDNNFNRDTATIIVLAPRIIVTLKADAPVLQKDSSWATRLSVKVKNIGDLDLSAVQVKLNLKDVFPSPVTYVLDSVRVSGSTVVPNLNYDGVQSNDLFSRVNKRVNPLPADIARVDIPSHINGVSISGLIDHAGEPAIAEVHANIGHTLTDSTGENLAAGDEHSVYMFGALSQLPVGIDGTMLLYLHIRPNGYYEPFIMQAVALGTGKTEEGTALASSLSNDNENTAAHPDLTKKGDPIPTVINLIPNPLIGVSLSAGAAVDQGNGTYHVLLSYKLKNYGNVNLQSIKLFQNLARMIGSPSTFTMVGGITATGTLLPNTGFNASTDTNMLAPESELGYKQEGTMQFTISITPNQLASLYRLQVTASGIYSELNITNTDLSNNGADPDPDGNSVPSERVITLITINLPVIPLVPGGIGININPPLRSTVLSKSYCGSGNDAILITTSVTTGGSGPYEFQWQRSANDMAFTDIPNATDSVYITAGISSNTYLRRRVISDNQIGYSNSVLILVTAATKPVISASGPLVLPQNGSVTLTSTEAGSYTWSNAATTRSIVVGVAGVGVYHVTATDPNGCPVVSDPVTVGPPPPVTVNRTYIIGASSNPANSGVQVTGFPGATLNYYLLSLAGTLVPVPVLPGVISVSTYYVSQTINGIESVRVPYTVTMIDKVADLQKRLSKSPALQGEGSFLMSFTILASNLRAEQLDSVKIKDDLTKVFPVTAQFEVVSVKASGKLISNASYNGNTQIEMLADGSQLPAMQTDSVQVSLKVFANGFSGTLNNVAEQTAKSPYGVFKVTSNDPTVSNGLLFRAPTPFIIPLIELFIPSGFSPNRDGTNDVFAISKPFSMSISLEVFNRWGNLVYRSGDYKSDWNGRGNQPNNILGEELPDGTYYYIVLATDKLNGTVKKFAGFITLKR